MKTTTVLRRLKKLQKELDKTEGWDDRQIILRKSSNDIIRSLNVNAIIQLVSAARELSEILNDKEARKEIDSLTVQPLDLALLKLEDTNW